jgi:hypothetical protein
LVLGAKYVSWLDFWGYEGLSQKQFMLNHLSESSLLTVITHPKLKSAYTADDFKYLCNYSVLEVFNQYAFSIAFWDSALSSGHAAFLLADDDCHDIDEPLMVQRCYTMVNTGGSRTQDGIIDALKAGCSYGVDFNMGQNEQFVGKIADARKMKTVKSVTVNNNILTVIYPEKAKWIRFIGQNGIVKNEVKNTDSASYTLKPTDTYIRTEIALNNLTKIYLNPVIRYNGKSLPYYTAKVNTTLTALYRAVILLVLIIISWFIVWRMLRIIRKPAKRIIA